MDFRVGEDQRELAEGIRAMVAGRLPLEHLRAREGDPRAIDGDDWLALGETGVFALTLPEPLGTGLSMAEAVVVFEELGRALVPGPLVGTFLAARAGVVEGAADGRAQVGVHCAGDGGAGAGPGPVLSSTSSRSMRCSSLPPTARVRPACSPPSARLRTAPYAWKHRSTR